MTVALELPMPANGVALIEPTNGVNGIVVPYEKPVALLPAIPPPRLVDSETIAVLAKRFNLDNFVNKHEVHKRELTDLDVESVDIRDNTFVDTMINLKVKNNHHWRRIMDSRQSIATHLQFAIEDSDKLLQDLTEVTEKLDVAEHECAVAVQKYQNAEKRRLDLESQLEIANCELGRARLRMIKLAKDRDEESVKAQVAQHQVHIRDGQIVHFKKDAHRLQSLVLRLTAEHAAAVEAAREAQKGESFAKQEAEEARGREEQWKKEKERIESQYQQIVALYSKLTEENTKLQGDFTVNKELLFEAEKQVSHLSKALKQLEEQVKRLEEERRKFDAILKQSLDDRQKAIDREQKAVQERADAETERDRAVDSEKEWMRRYSEALTIMEETKSSLEKEIHEKEDIKVERDHAVNRAHVACHYAQESLEWGQALNLINHQLLGEWETMQKDKISAVEARLLAERQSVVVLGESTGATEKIIGLEAELALLQQGQRAALADRVSLETQFTETKDKLQAQLDGKTEELAGIHIAQLGWEKEKAALAKSLDNEASELAKASAKITELEAQHASAETVLQQEVRKLSASIKELEDSREAQIEEELSKLKATFKETEESIRAEAEKRITVSVKKGLERVKHGVEFDNVIIQDIFYAGQRLDEHKRSDVFNKIGSHWGSSEALHVEPFFNEKKKLLVVVYRTKKDDESRILTNSDGNLKFPKN
ncbi:uncharacterized protein N7511_005840 [Penicillium nucicola]|uniref:uncharacterized protein n=1 Tax=Penicillium nucicola TaxID=1850975 RepID=UPI0025459521|nr:uncharacterized protein N7511_005840 [Penicillium nucicola]KAJ5762458.1 hypothetical protein N7511_005840 [Penicillium nucicola]